MKVVALAPAPARDVFPPLRRDAAAALALVVAGHLALLTQLGTKGPEALATRSASPAAAPRITWLALRPSQEAAAPAPGVQPVQTAAPRWQGRPAPAAAPEMVVAPLVPRPEPAATAAMPAAAEVPAEVRGVPVGGLPGSLVGLAALAAPRLEGWRSPPRGPAPEGRDVRAVDAGARGPAPGPLDDPAARVVRDQLREQLRDQMVAAAWRQLDALEALPAGDSGRCAEGAGREWVCDHPAAQRALAPAVAALAPLLRQLAASGGPSATAVVTYADGRFGLELR